MQNEPFPADSGRIQSDIKDASKSLEESVTSAYDTLCQETSQLVSSANDAIRKNPMPAVVGAAVFGAAVCYLILSGRHQETFRERYLDEPLADAGDSINATVRSLYKNLKFW